MVSIDRIILDVAYKNKCSHLGSYFTASPIIDSIFKNKKEEDIFILSSGHAAIALYAALEKYYNIDANELFLKHGGHPHRDEDNHIYCSTGSLGMGITVAVGRALANPNRTMYCYLMVSAPKDLYGKVLDLYTIIILKILKFM